jgi:hypothetical protein
MAILCHTENLFPLSFCLLSALHRL